MKITVMDWVVVALYFGLNLGIGLYYRRRASKNTGEFFVSGREVSWWLAGTSMVAATFAADTPLAVTGLVATQGLAGNWLWLSLIPGGMMTVFFFARLWRRSEVITDVEFVELRYSGKAAAFLRGFRALYFGVLMNCIIVGWVNLAMEKILGVVFGVSQYVALMIIFGIIGFTFLYTFISGLWGVLWTDLIQFVIKMSMVTVLAYYAVAAVGGMTALKSKLALVSAARRAAHGGTDSILSFFPSLHSAWLPFLTFAMYLSVQWWANWYPGSEPGGGGYIAQRIFCAKDEKQSLYATLWFNVAEYAIRPWPWIITALVSVVLYPHLRDPEIGYIKVWVDHLPGGWNGLMLAAFAAAYMSTIATQMNWGSSYIVNDFYRRFVAKDKDEHHYVIASKVSTGFLALLGAAVSLVMTTVTGAWELVLGIGAGTGAVYLLRWYWWRINAWSEVAAMTCAGLTTLVFQTVVHFSGSQPIVFAKQVLVTISLTTLVWLVVTFLTPPEGEAKLLAFYRHVRPGAVGWKPIARLAPEIDPSSDAWSNLKDMVLGCLLIYFAIFGTGKIILGSYALGMLLLVLSAVSGFGIYWDFSKRGWEKLSGRV